MGLIQTVDQLKFSYMAIAEGARQGNLINSDSPALSAILPSSNKTNISPSHLTRAYTATSRILDSSSSSDSSSDFDYGLGPPPLPPPRSESLLASNSNRQGVPEQRLYQQQVYVNANLVAARKKFTTIPAFRTSKGVGAVCLDCKKIVTIVL